MLYFHWEKNQGQTKNDIEAEKLWDICIDRSKRRIIEGGEK